MIDPMEVEATILELGSEDRYGLHEVICALNARYPDVPKAAKISAARQVISTLVGSGRLILYRQRWAEKDSTTPLDLVESVRSLENPSNWEPGEDLVTFEVASKAGGAA